jgi:hypothetical protein
MEVEMPGKSFRERRRASSARVNERAVNIKQNEPHHPDRLPEFEIFRENYQPKLAEHFPASAWVTPTFELRRRFRFVCVWSSAFRRQIAILPVNRLKAELPTAVSPQAFGLRVSRLAR